MKLSRLERLLLANQYRILESLYPDDGYARTRQALEHGYELEEEEIAQNVYEKGLSKDECIEVIETLSMFEALKDSYDALSNRSGINETDVQFSGYSGNDETSFMTYVQYLVEGGRFAHVVTNRQFNSHFPARDIYRAMFRVFERIPGGTRRHQLTTAELKAIIDAR